MQYTTAFPVHTHNLPCIVHNSTQEYTAVSVDIHNLACVVVLSWTQQHPRTHIHTKTLHNISSRQTHLCVAVVYSSTPKHLQYTQTHTHTHVVVVRSNAPSSPHTSLCCCCAKQYTTAAPSLHMHTLCCYCVRQFIVAPLQYPHTLVLLLCRALHNSSSHYT